MGSDSLMDKEENYNLTLLERKQPNLFIGWLFISCSPKSQGGDYSSPLSYEVVSGPCTNARVLLSFY